MAMAKIQTVEGKEWRLFAKQKILLGIDRLDRRNGRRIGVAFYDWVWYNLFAIIWYEKSMRYDNFESKSQDIRTM